MAAQVERQYDEYERMAIEAVMRENAHRSKRTKVKDLFKRPISDDEAKERTDTLNKQTEQATAWLSQFMEFNRKEETDG